MSYTPYTWHTGDTITAERLNNITREAFQNVFIINNNSGVLDKTFNEVKEAFLKGKTCLIYTSDSDNATYDMVATIQNTSGNYSVNYQYYTNSNTGYPGEV